MKTLVIGGVVFVLGVICLVVWISAFLQVLAGAIPIMLILGGALAIYLGFDELRDSWKKEDADTDTSFPSAASEDTDKLKQEIEDLKKENEELKKSDEEKEE